MANTLIILSGLPRCGKSTYSRSLPHAIVNPDSIRLEVFNTVFDPKVEKEVWKLAHNMVNSLFLAGCSTVIVDATNTTIQRRNEWKPPADNTHGVTWKREFHIFLTPKQLCVERAISDNRNYLVPVIERMGENFTLPDSQELIDTEAFIVHPPLSGYVGYCLEVYNYDKENRKPYCSA